MLGRARQTRVRTFVALLLLGFGSARGQPLTLFAGGAIYDIDPTTIEIHTRTGAGEPRLVLPALLSSGEVWTRTRDHDGWRWSGEHGSTIAVRADGPDLSLTISKTGESTLSAALPVAAADDT